MKREIRPGAALAAGVALGVVFALAVWDLTPLRSGGSPPTSISAVQPPAPATAYTVLETLLAASPGGRTVATLIPATPIQVLGTQGSSLQVGLDLYRSPGSPTILYQDPSTLARGAVLASPGDAQPTGTVSVAGSSWQRVHLVGWVARSATSPDVTRLWSEASSLYGQSCSSCHTAHDPGEFTGRQWVSQFRAMAPRTSLTPAQADLILKWLQAHAGKQ